MTYNMERIYSSKDFESLSGTQLMILFKEVKLITLDLHDMKRIKKANADLALMRQIIKGFNQIHNREEWM